MNREQMDYMLLFLLLEITLRGISLWQILFIISKQIQQVIITLPTSSTSIGYYINYTPITTTGNITNGSLKGYLAANQICNVYYSGSHMCQAGEILNSINRNQSNVNFTATFRITEGAP